jgi:hypothetical protein
MYISSYDESSLHERKESLSSFVRPEAVFGGATDFLFVSTDNYTC